MQNHLTNNFLNNFPETEGVIKFNFRLNRRRSDISAKQLRLLTYTKKMLLKRGWFGESQNIGYGNFSFLDKPNRRQNRLWVSASQTSHLRRVKPKDFVQVLYNNPQTNIDKNFLRARGLKQPSSESLSHVQIYRSDVLARAVIHIHDHRLWAQHHGLLQTPAEAEYGTKEMALAIKQVYRREKYRHQNFIGMEGHLGGIIAWGSSLLDTFRNLKKLQRRERSSHKVK